MTLDYSKSLARRPYPYFSLVTAGVCLALMGGYYLVNEHELDRFMGPAAYFSTARRGAQGVTVIAEAAGMAAVVLAFLRYQSKAHVTAVLVAAVFAMGAVPWVFLGCEEEWHGCRYPYFISVESNGRMLAQRANIQASVTDQYPPRLAALLPDDPDLLEYITDSDFTLPAAPTKENWPLVAADVDAHSEFIYCGGDLPASYAGTLPRVILLYSRPSPHYPGYRVVVYGDAHSALISETELPSSFAFSNRARAKLGLPGFELDGPLPAPK